VLPDYSINLYLITQRGCATLKIFSLDFKHFFSASCSGKAVGYSYILSPFTRCRPNNKYSNILVYTQNVYMHIYMYVCMCVYICIYIYVCVCVFMLPSKSSNKTSASNTNYFQKFPLPQNRLITSIFTVALPYCNLTQQQLIRPTVSSFIHYVVCLTTGP